MTVIKIYKITCTQGYQMTDQGEGFSLDPWGSDTDYYKGYDDGGKNYILPGGYEIAQTQYGDTAIFCGDNHCKICIHSSGRPQLVSVNHSRPVLLESPRGGPGVNTEKQNKKNYP